MKKIYILLCGMLSLCAASCKRGAEILPESAQKVEAANPQSSLTAATVTPLLIAGKRNEGGFVDGVGANARFNTINGIFVDGDGSLYVCDFDNSAVRKISTSNKVTTLNINPDLFDSPMIFGGPRNVAVLDNGTVGVQAYNKIFLYKNGAVFKTIDHIESFGRGQFGGLDEGHDGTYFNFVSNRVNPTTSNYGSSLGVIKNNNVTGALKTISPTRIGAYLEGKLNATKYVVLDGRLFKYTSTGVTEVYKDFNPDGSIISVAVNKAGTEIYVAIDYGSVKRIRNNQIETLISGVKANFIALANSEKFLYYATADNTINRIPLP